MPNNPWPSFWRADHVPYCLQTLERIDTLRRSFRQTAREQNTCRARETASEWDRIPYEDDGSLLVPSDNVVSVLGTRGVGKTTVVKHVVQLLQLSPEEVENLSANPAGIDSEASERTKKLLGKKDCILRIVPPEYFAPGDTLGGWMLHLIEKIIENELKMQDSPRPASGWLEGSWREPEERNRASRRRQSPDSAYADRLRQLHTTVQRLRDMEAIVSREFAMGLAGQNVSQEEFLRETAESVSRTVEFLPEWQKFVDRFLNTFFRRDSVLIVPIDDADLTPLTLPGLLQQLRLLGVRRVVFLFSANLVCLEQELQVFKLRGKIYGHKMHVDSLVTMIKTYNELPAADQSRLDRQLKDRLTKTLPSHLRVEMNTLTAREQLTFRPFHDDIIHDYIYGPPSGDPGDDRDGGAERAHSDRAQSFYELLAIFDLSHCFRGHDLSLADFFYTKRRVCAAVRHGMRMKEEGTPTFEASACPCDKADPTLQNCLFTKIRNAVSGSSPTSAEPGINDIDEEFISPYTSMLPTQPRIMLQLYRELHPIAARFNDLVLKTMKDGSGGRPNGNNPYADAMRDGVADAVKVLVRYGLAVVPDTGEYSDCVQILGKTNDGSGRYDVAFDLKTMMLSIKASHDTPLRTMSRLVYQGEDAFSYDDPEQLSYPEDYKILQSVVKMYKFQKITADLHHDAVYRKLKEKYSTPYETAGADFPPSYSADVREVIDSLARTVDGKSSKLREQAQLEPRRVPDSVVYTICLAMDLVGPMWLFNCADDAHIYDHRDHYPLNTTEMVFENPRGGEREKIILRPGPGGCIPRWLKMYDATLFITMWNRLYAYTKQLVRKIDHSSGKTPLGISEECAQVARDLLELLCNHHNDKSNRVGIPGFKETLKIKFDELCKKQQATELEQVEDKELWRKTLAEMEGLVDDLKRSPEDKELSKRLYGILNHIMRNTPRDLHYQQKIALHEFVMLYYYNAALCIHQYRCIPDPFQFLQPDALYSKIVGHINEVAKNQMEYALKQKTNHSEEKLDPGNSLTGVDSDFAKIATALMRQFNHHCGNLKKNLNWARASSVLSGRDATLLQWLQYSLPYSVDFSCAHYWLFMMIRRESGDLGGTHLSNDATDRDYWPTGKNMLPDFYYAEVDEEIAYEKELHGKITTIIEARKKINKYHQEMTRLKNMIKSCENVSEKNLFQDVVNKLDDKIKETQHRLSQEIKLANNLKKKLIQPGQEMPADHSLDHFYRFRTRFGASVLQQGKNADAPSNKIGPVYAASVEEAMFKAMRRCARGWTLWAFKKERP